MRNENGPEILDIDMNDIITYKKDIIESKQNNINNNSKVIPKKRKIKKGLWQRIFYLTSILFIIGCFIFYGTRLIKYYKIYNPKAENGKSVLLLYQHITKKNPIVYDADGLYKVGNGYVYKGKNVNNYLKLGNLIFRIVSISRDGYIKAILDDHINIIAWNKEITSFVNSDISKYINDKFLNGLNTNLLAKSSVCTDEITEISEITCNNINTDNYIKLLDITEFLNSFTDDTYISNDETLWLSSYGNKVAWNTNGKSVSYSDPSSMYLVKPIITLQNNIPYLEGIGTKEKPYLTSKHKKELIIGSYVKLENDLWIVYENNEDNVKLVLNKTLPQIYQFSSYNNKYSSNADKSIGKYLNTTYYNSLEYKSMLLNTKWYIGNYKNSYKDIYNEYTMAKVGIYNLADLKFNNSLDNYYLSTLTSDNNVYVYGENIKTSKMTISRGIRPTISISKMNIISGEGIINSPYVLGGNE